MKPIPCVTGKQRHASQGAAAAHLRGLRRKNAYVGRVYPCLQCAGWHVGREKQRAHKNKFA